MEQQPGAEIPPPAQPVEQQPVAAAQPVMEQQQVPPQMLEQQIPQQMLEQQQVPQEMMQAVAAMPAVADPNAGAAMGGAIDLSNPDMSNNEYLINLVKVFTFH